jgi:hypothetical protein
MAGKSQKCIDKRREKRRAVAVQKKTKKATLPPPADEEQSEGDTEKTSKPPAHNAGEQFGRAAPGSGKAKASIL